MEHSGNSYLFQFLARQKVKAFKLKEDLRAGKAYALATDHYGPEAGVRYCNSAKDRMSMEKGPLTELTSP